MKKIIAAVSLTCTLGLALPYPASPGDRETGRPRGFGFVQMANGDETVLLVCKTPPELLTEDELGRAVLAFVAKTGSQPGFVGFRPLLMPIAGVFRIDESHLMYTLDCSWRSDSLVP